MNKLLLSLGCIISFAANASARLDETFQQCQERYGVLQRVESKFRPDYPQYVFLKGEIEIRVRFYKEKSAQEIFSAPNRELTSNERDDILEANRSTKEFEMRWDSHYYPSLHSDVLKVETKEFAAVFKEAGETGF